MIRRTPDPTLTLLTAAVLAGALLTSATAVADQLTSGHGAEIVEQSHQITIDLDDDKLARATVHRVFENRSDHPDELVLDFVVPDEASLTALRMRDPDTGQWHDAALEAADLADDIYHDPGTTRARARRAALLSWKTRNRLRLELTPVPAFDVVEVEYDLVIPTHYVDGRHRLDWSVEPEGDTALAVPELRWTRALHGLELRADVDATPTPVTPDTTVELTGPLTFDAPASGVEVVGTRLARVDVRDGLTVVQIGLDAAPQLAPMPERATVVLLVDASHSMEAEGVERQLAIARSMVGQLPDAHVQIVVYRRFAERLFEHPVLGRELDAHLSEAIERGAFEPGNGSALDLALAEAVDIVAGREPGTAARIVAMTDELLRPGWSNQTVLDQTLASLDDDTVLHVVEPGAGYGEVADQRDDDASLAPLALAHGGVRVDLDVSLDSDAYYEEALARATLGLIRPTHIDHLELVGVDAAAFDTELPRRLDEGDGWQSLARLVDRPVDGPVTVRGELWSTPFEQTMPRSADYDQAVAGHLAVAYSSRGGLSDDDVYTLATLGHVVSEQTSLRVELQVGRYEARMWGSGYGFGSVGCGGSRCGGVTSCRAASTAAPDIDVHEVLASALASCLPRSGISASELEGRVTIAFDTTHDEIVDVVSEVADGAAPQSQALAACLVEATWATRLDSRFYGKIKRYTASF